MSSKTKQANEAVSEAFAHKTICNWITASTGIRQQLTEADSFVSNAVVHKMRPK